MKMRVSCPGLPYPDYSESNRLEADGWKVVDAKVDIPDRCVWLTMEKEN